MGAGAGVGMGMSNRASLRDGDAFTAAEAVEDPARSLWEVAAAVSEECKPPAPAASASRSPGGLHGGGTRDGTLRARASPVVALETAGGGGGSSSVRAAAAPRALLQVPRQTADTQAPQKRTGSVPLGG